MQQTIDCFSNACDNFGRTISTRKTEVLHQSVPQKMYVAPAITAKEETLNAVDKFAYLGSTLSRSANIDGEVNSRIAKRPAQLSDDFASPKVSWERRGIRLTTKLKVYKAVVLSSLVLYACETWTVYERHAKELNRFHLNCLRKLLKITWRDKVPDTEVLSLADL